jgi:poly-D-alanine transfer protein DltD
MLRNAKSAVIGQHIPVRRFVNADPQQLKFDEIENEIQATVQAELSTNNYGISLEFLGFKKIEPARKRHAAVLSA